MLYFASRRVFKTRDSVSEFRDDRVSQPTRYVAMPDGAVLNTSHMKTQAEWAAEVANVSDLVLVVHGFNTTHAEMRSSIAQVRDTLATTQFKGRVVGFDWPSAGSIGGYWADQGRAKAASERLVEDVLAPLWAANPKLRIHAYGHSMGAFLLLEALLHAADSAVSAKKSWKLEQLVFTAADITVREFSKGVAAAEQIQRRTKRFTNYFSSHDDVLNGSAIANFFGNGMQGERLGWRGLPNDRPSVASFQDVNCTPFYSSEVNPTLNQSDNMEILLISHRWYYSNDILMGDLARSLNGDSDTSRPNRRPIKGSSDFVLVP